MMVTVTQVAKKRNWSLYNDLLRTLSTITAIHSVSFCVTVPMMGFIYFSVLLLAPALAIEKFKPFVSKLSSWDDYAKETIEARSGIRFLNISCNFICFVILQFRWLEYETEMEKKMMMNTMISRRLWDS